MDKRRNEGAPTKEAIVNRPYQLVSKKDYILRKKKEYPENGS